MVIGLKRVKKIISSKKWAEDIDGLALRSEMRDRVKKSPLVDGKRFAENLEKAFRFMWEDWVEQQEAQKEIKGMVSEHEKEDMLDGDLP